MNSRRTFASRADPASGWNPLTLALFAGVWLAVLPNWPLWRALLVLPETASLRGGLFVAGFGAMIAALMTALLALFAWRLSIKPVITLMLLAAAFGAHFMGSYGVVIDTTMMANVVQTDPREVRDLLSWRMVVNVGVLAALPLWLLWRAPLARTRWWPQTARNLLGFVAALLVLAGLLFALFADLSATMRNHRSMRYLINPANSLYALVDLAAQSSALPAGPPLAIGLDARIKPRAASSLPPLLLLVESDRPGDCPKCGMALER
ncbi:MAG: phosphoethanolamine transferase domain-containing protein, partial [Burkholderiales bacterium]